MTASSFYSSTNSPAKVLIDGAKFCTGSSSFDSSTLRAKRSDGEWIKIEFNTAIKFATFSFQTFTGNNIKLWKLEGLFADAWRTLYESKVTHFQHGYDNEVRTFFKTNGNPFIFQ